MDQQSWVHQWSCGFAWCSAIVQVYHKLHIQYSKRLRIVLLRLILILHIESALSLPGAGGCKNRRITYIKLEVVDQWRMIKFWLQLDLIWVNFQKVEQSFSARWRRRKICQECRAKFDFWMREVLKIVHGLKFMGLTLTSWECAITAHYQPEVTKASTLSRPDKIWDFMSKCNPRNFELAKPCLRLGWDEKLCHRPRLVPVL